MRYSSKKYAQALYESTAGQPQKEQEKILAQFLSVLERYHDHSLLPRITEAYEKIRRRREKIVKVEVVTAKKVKNSLLDQIREKFDKKVEFVEKIVPEVLGGLKLTVNDEYLIDGTFQGRVDKLYKQMMEAAEK